MRVRSRAPVRIDLAGGWTDVSPFADREGGAVVNVAISRYAYVSLQPCEGHAIRLHSDDYGSSITAGNLAELVYDGRLDLVKAALKRFGLQGGIDLITRADVPPGSGLGTSAAMGVAIIGGLGRWEQRQSSPAEVAAQAHQLEVTELGIAGGKQDQLAAALGGVNFLEFSATAPTITPLDLAPAMLKELEKRLVLCYSGISRLSGDIIERVQQAYLHQDPATCTALHTLCDLARASKQALLAGAIDELGLILGENWRCQRALHPSVTNREVDALFEVAERSGALGGKACGAGGGGCLVFLAADNQERRLRNDLADAGAQMIDFSIDRFGLQTWQIDSASGKVL